MLSLNYKSILYVCLVLFFFQSCSEDESESDSFDSLVEAELRRGGQGGNQNGQGGGGGGGQGNNQGENQGNGINVSLLENDVVMDWMDLFMRLERYATGMRPNVSARALGYINLAGYETAVPGMREFESNDGKISGFRFSDASIRGQQINWNVALNACYADVMDHFLLNVPSNLMTQIAQLEEVNEALFSANVIDEIIDDSKNWGEYVAAEIIAYSQTDNKAETQALDPQPTSYVPPTGDGYWTFTAEPSRALFPYWGSVRTFVVDVNETTTRDPIRYSENPNSDYYKEMEEVYTVNNTAKEEDNEDLWIAEFWGDDVEGLTFGPPTRQISIANQLARQYDMDLETTLHMYLKLGFALNDAAVSAWKYKYDHMVQRPTDFIHEFIDDSFETNLFRLIPWLNPSFPGYPSGHSTFASAAGGVFISFFGNSIDFTDRSHEGRTEFRGTPRTYNSIKDFARENAFSRIPLGVHIRMDCEEGLRLGYEISDGINKYRVNR